MSINKIPVYIVKHKHGFSISTTIIRMETAILEYSERLNAPKLTRSRGQISIDVGDAYYLRIPKLRKWIFHITHLESLKEFIHIKLRNTQDPYEFIESSVGNDVPFECEYKDYGFDMLVDDPTSRFFYQNEVVDTACTDGREHTIFAIQTGRGKLLKYGTPVLTPSGWVDIKDIRVNDQVIGRDGLPTTVTNYFPQTNVKMFELITFDGRKVTICEDHQWQASINGVLGIYDTKTLAHALRWVDVNISIPACQPEATKADVLMRRLRDVWENHCTYNEIYDELVYTATSLEDGLEKQELLWACGGTGRLDRETLIIPINHTDFSKGVVPAVGIRSITSVENGDGACITVDNEDSLYVIKDYLVTHNTKSSQKVMVKKCVRTAIIVRPTYIDKWMFDTCDDKTGLREKRKHVWVVEGIQGMLDLISAGRTGELDKRNIKVIIIPTVTLGLFLKDVAEFPEYYSDIDLFEFYNYIKVGLVMQDEVHEHFRVVYLAAIALNPPAMLEMSATLDPSASKAFIRDRYMERFPLRARLSVDYIPVVDIRGINYRINDNSFIDKVNRMKMYSHTEFENLIEKHGLRLQYFEMIWDLLERGYLKEYQKGQRALVFFSLIKMCEEFRLFLNKKLKDSEYNKHKLNVAKYNGGDSFTKFINADIGVSTPGKAGTAVDIPGLIFAVVTVAIDDKQFNEQIAGRPREQFQWNLTPKVCFLQTQFVPKHQRYLTSRYNALKDIVKSFTVTTAPYVLEGNKNADIKQPKWGSNRFSPRKAKGIPKCRTGTRFVSRGRKRR